MAQVSGRGVKVLALMLSLRPQKHSLQWRRKVYSGEAEVKLAYIGNIAHPISDWSVFMPKRNPNPHSLIEPKSTLLIGQNGAALMQMRI